MSNYRGFFITFEGGEGSSKTTQLELVVNRLELLGFDVIATKEPGSPHCKACVEIREILLNPEIKLSDQGELMLYIADRTEHMQSLVIPGLLAGKLLLSDRHDDSTFAYQHHGRGLDFWDVNNLNLKATAGIEPNLTVLLDIEPEVGFARLKGGHDRLEMAGLEFHKRVNEGYRQIARDFPERFVIIDAAKPIEVIQEEIFCITVERLDKAGLWKNTIETTAKGGEKR